MVRPGGHLLFVNHFLAERGVRRAVEKALAPLSHALGWHPDFDAAELFGAEIPGGASFKPLAPAGIFTLVHLPR